MNSRNHPVLCSSTTFPSTPLSIGSKGSYVSPSAYIQTTKGTRRINYDKESHDHIESRKDPLVTIIIKVGGGKEELIDIQHEDKLDELADDIAKRHNLPNDVKNSLKKNIQTTINGILKNKRESQVNLNSEVIDEGRETQQ